jgi:hypothetical protein
LPSLSELLQKPARSLQSGGLLRCLPFQCEHFTALQEVHAATLPVRAGIGRCVCAVSPATA